MVADFMAQPAQFLIRVIFLFSFASCQEQQTRIEIIDFDQIQEKNGIVYNNGTLFFGMALAKSNQGTTLFSQSYKNGKEDGVWKKFYDNGQLAEQRIFKNGKKSDSLIAFWPNGTKHLLYRFKDGEYEGTCSEWNQQGILIKEMNYQKGQETGSQKIFYDNGSIKANYKVINGRQYGLIGTKNCINVSDSIFNN